VNSVGDHHFVCCNQSGILIAAIDGIGHGEEAANAAEGAVFPFSERVRETCHFAVQRCHEELRCTRGVGLSLASITEAWHDDMGPRRQRARSI